MHSKSNAEWKSTAKTTIKNNIKKHMKKTEYHDISKTKQRHSIEQRRQVDSKWLFIQSFYLSQQIYLLRSQKLWGCVERIMVDLLTLKELCFGWTHVNSDNEVEEVRTAFLINCLLFALQNICLSFVFMSYGCWDWIIEGQETFLFSAKPFWIPHEVVRVGQKLIHTRTCCWVITHPISVFI